MQKFCLVDFAAHYQKGFRNHIVPITEVPGLVEAFRRYGCYATYFFYSDEVLAYMSAHPEGETPSIAGYDGKVWAPMFPLDLDHPELGVALEAAKFFVSFFLERWKIDPKGIQVYFSGSKGFHLMLDRRLFGRIFPSKSLAVIFASLRSHFAQSLPLDLKETVDLGIKDRVRLLRLPNTMHEKSGLYKVILSLDELSHLRPDEIREIARKPRPLALTDETGLLPRARVTENPEARQLFERIRRQVRRIARKPFRYRFRHPPDLARIVFPCAGMQKIWESHVEPGYRNNCAIRLASHLRLFGLTENEAGEKLFEWNEKNSIGLPHRELQSVIHSAYQRRFPYRYGCRDTILRRFCPFPDYDACRTHVLSYAQGEKEASRK